LSVSFSKILNQASALKLSRRGYWTFWYQPKECELAAFTTRINAFQVTLQSYSPLDRPNWNWRLRCEISQWRKLISTISHANALPTELRRQAYLPLLQIKAS